MLFDFAGPFADAAEASLDGTAFTSDGSVAMQAFLPPTSPASSEPDSFVIGVQGSARFLIRYVRFVPGVAIHARGFLSAVLARWLRCTLHAQE